MERDIRFTPSNSQNGKSTDGHSRPFSHPPSPLPPLPTLPSIPYRITAIHRSYCNEAPLFHSYDSIFAAFSFFFFSEASIPGGFWNLSRTRTRTFSEQRRANRDSYWRVSKPRLRAMISEKYMAMYGKRVNGVIFRLGRVEFETIFELARVYVKIDAFDCPDSAEGIKTKQLSQ